MTYIINRFTATSRQIFKGFKFCSYWLFSIDITAVKGLTEQHSRRDRSTRQFPGGSMEFDMHGQDNTVEFSSISGWWCGLTVHTWLQFCPALTWSVHNYDMHGIEVAAGMSIFDTSNLVFYAQSTMTVWINCTCILCMGIEAAAVMSVFDTKHAWLWDVWVLK